ncbi:unnamed protein product [Colias eurytheme]|nr:unnamed protein product [Colias eurytheme]
MIHLKVLYLLEIPKTSVMQQNRAQNADDLFALLDQYKTCICPMSHRGTQNWIRICHSNGAHMVRSQSVDWSELGASRLPPNRYPASGVILICINAKVVRIVRLINHN